MFAIPSIEVLYLPGDRQIAKDERRVKLQEALTTFSPGRQDLYIPTNPEARGLGHIPASGACMQSAAKVGGLYHQDL